MLKFTTFTELFENEGLKKKAAKSGISLGTLKKVYNRGMAAWKTGHRPGTNPQQWGMARVNSYIGKGKGTYYGADSDLSGKGKKKKESVGEAHDPKHIKQAIGIASDPRYKQGNMTGAVKAMNKISKDIDKHPQVAAVLRKQNEATVKEISNWKHYSFALSANFIKDYQLTRELRGLPKSDWKFKFASYTTKPDLHLINFTSFLSNRTLLDKFLENRLNN